jgi:hypothetical protein
MTALVVTSGAAFAVVPPDVGGGRGTKPSKPTPPPQKVCKSGRLASGDTVVDVAAGQITYVVISNRNVLPLLVKVNQTPGTAQAAYVLPGQDKKLKFGVFGQQPIGYTFKLSTPAQSLLAGYRIESSICG